MIGLTKKQIMSTEGLRFSVLFIEGNRRTGVLDITHRTIKRRHIVKYVTALLPQYLGNNWFPGKYNYLYEPGQHFLGDRIIFGYNDDVDRIFYVRYLL